MTKDLLKLVLGIYTSYKVSLRHNNKDDTMPPGPLSKVICNVCQYKLINLMTIMKYILEAK